MDLDRINIDVVRLTPLAANGSLSTVESIGASQLEGYLQDEFGSDVPETERAQRVSGALLRSLAKLSTDPEYSILAQLEPLDFLPHWLNLVEPTISSARTAGGYVHQELTDRENNEVAAKLPISEDFMFVYSAFELSTHALAVELGLEHPSDLAVTNDPEQQGSKREQRKSLELYASHPKIKASYRRRVKEVQRLGGQAVDSTASLLPRLTEAAERISAAE